MSLSPDAPRRQQLPAAAAAPASGDKLATVDIGSNRPRDVETDPEAGSKAAPTTVTTASGTAPEQPVIPMQAKPAAAAPVTAPKPVEQAPKPTVAAAPPPAAAPAPATRTVAAGTGSYTLNLSAYANASSVSNLERRVRGLGYPVSGHPMTVRAARRVTAVIAGPFATRTAAEAARLKITQSIPGAPARLEQDASHESAAAPAAPAAATASSKAGGWAVQLAAVSCQADANALRDKLRANGFDGFVDSVQAGGKQLWRVRAGPQTQRADAQRVHDQIKAKMGLDGNVVSVP